MQREGGPAPPSRACGLGPRGRGRGAERVREGAVPRFRFCGDTEESWVRTEKYGAMMGVRRERGERGVGVGPQENLVP